MENFSPDNAALHFVPDSCRIASVETEDATRSRSRINDHLRPQRYDEELMMAYAPFSAEADRYRHVRNHLLALLRPPYTKSLAVISPSSTRNASAFVANLAISFSHAGLNTLLVDTNLRHPKQHDVFQLGGGTGLSDLLAGESNIDGIHRIDDIPGLSVITAGRVTPTPQDLLSRPALLEVCARLLSGYDMVIYDVAATDSASDYLAVASQTRHALLMAHQNMTTVHRLREMEKALFAIGCSIAGSVMLEA